VQSTDVDAAGEWADEIASSSCGSLRIPIGLRRIVCLAAPGSGKQRPPAPAERTGRELRPCRVIYDFVRDSRGERARVILTRPHDGSGRYPAIFIAGWLSCDSVEAPADTDDASGKVFRVLAELPGFVTVRMDKPGVGDSEGER
jgi:hypothetical protein